VGIADLPDSDSGSLGGASPPCRTNFVLRLMRVNGPYLWKTGRNAGRRYVTIVHDDGRRTSMTWARFQLLSKVWPGQDVHHKDDDKSNDTVENYQVLEHRHHAKIGAVGALPVPITCIWCGSRVEKLSRHLDHNAVQGKAGPFCSKRCVGLYAAHIKKGGEPFDVQPRCLCSERFYGRLVK